MGKIIELVKIRINNTEIGKHMLISTICKPLSMIISYIYIPLVLNYLGVEKYGIWSTILTILSWISYFDIGVGNGLRNKLTESLAKKDNKGRKLVSSAYAFLSVLMTAMVIIFSIVAFTIDWNRVFGVTDIKENLAYLVIISVIFISFNFVLSICKNVLYALQKAGVVSIMELATQLLNLVGIIIVSLVLPSNLFAMSFIYGFSMIFVNLFASIVVYKKNREISPRLGSVDIIIGKSVTNLGLQFFVIQICALILFTTDSLIISYLYGASNVTPYNTVNKLFSSLLGIYTAMIAPVWSSISKMNSEKKFNDIISMIKRLRHLMIPFVAATIILFISFRHISKIWLGQELEYSNSLILFGALYCLLSIWCNTYASISNGLEIMRISMVVALFQAVINIPLSLLFAIRFNMESGGILAGTVASMLIAAVVQPIVVNKTIKSRLMEGE